MFIKRAEITSAQSLKISFDQGLKLYEIENEAIRDMRQHLDAERPPEPSNAWERCRQFFNF